MNNEIELIKKMQKIVRAKVYKIYTISQDYKDDIYAECNVAIWEAIIKYNPDINNSIEAWILFCVDQKICDCFNKNTFYGNKREKDIPKFLTKSIYNGNPSEFMDGVGTPVPDKAGCNFITENTLEDKSKNVYNEVWEKELIEKIDEKLSELARKVFNLKLNPTKELFLKAKANYDSKAEFNGQVAITNRIVSEVLQIENTEMNKALNEIRNIFNSIVY